MSLARIILSYNDKLHHLPATGIPINPQSWFHQCTTIDTKSGIIWYYHHQTGNNFIIKETSSLLPMGRSCLTKWSRFSRILTILGPGHSKVNKRCWYFPGEKVGEPGTRESHRTQLTLKITFFINMFLGKLILGKGTIVGFWYQYQGEITNLNVYG